MSKPPSLSDQKNLIRQHVLRLRRQMGDQERCKASLLIAARILALPELGKAQVIGGYWPLPWEVDTTLLLYALHHRGYAVALPRVAGEDIIFHLWMRNDPLMGGAFGVMEPSVQSQIAVPDTLLVPVVAADHQGNRIGYGRGYYDRALSQLRRHGPVNTIGLAFACQMMERIPVEDRDERLDKIITEA
jgi:5-formyltetrahydrofolate cyclo-ligase